jgi:hypothetical protein
MSASVHMLLSRTLASSHRFCTKTVLFLKMKLQVSDPLGAYSHPPNEKSPKRVFLLYEAYSKGQHVRKLSEITSRKYL